MAKSLKWRSKHRETQDTTTTTVNLSPELWLIILSYLPRVYLWKMLRVSRTLYALAHPEIFRTLDLRYADSRAMWQLDNWLK